MERFVEFAVHDVGPCKIFGGGILTGSGMLDHGHPLPAHISSLLREKTGIDCTLPPAAIYCSKAGSAANYGHFLTDCAPAIHHLAANGFLGQFVLDAPKPHLAQVYDDVLVAIGIHPNRIIYLPQDQPVNVRSLRVTRGVSAHPNYKNPGILKAFVSAMLSNIRPCRRPRIAKLYVSRGQRWSWRGILNGDEVSQAIGPCESVAPSDLSFAEQVSTFYRARVVVGVMGAAMTNTIFCRQGTRVIYFAPYAMPGTYYKNLSEVIGLKYVEIRPNEANSNYNASFVVPVEKLRAEIKIVDRWSFRNAVSCLM